MVFIDQDQVEAMKTRIGCRAPRCDKDQFRAKMYLNHLPDIVVEHRGLNRKEHKKWHFHDRTLSGLAAFRVVFGHLYESC